MNLKSLLTSLALVAGTAALTTVVLQQSAASQDGGADAREREEAMKAGTPGEHHKALCSYAGTWKTKIKNYSSDPPETTESTAHFETIFDGRYVIERTHFKMMGVEWDEMGILGFDNTTGEHFRVWLDSLSTGCMVTRGKPVPKGQPLDLKGDVRDVRTPDGRPFHAVYDRIGPDEFNLSLHDSMPSERGFTEFKILDIRYTRDTSRGAR